MFYSRERVGELSASISTWRKHWVDAATVRDVELQKKFAAAPANLVAHYELSRGVYVKISSQQEAKDDPFDNSLRGYYRKAAKLFHPDNTGNDDKAGFFKLATEAYKDGDERLLKSIVLQELAANFETLSPENRTFLENELDSLVEVARELSDEAMRLVVEAGKISVMSLNMFMCMLEEAIKHFEAEIAKYGITLEASKPALPSSS